MYKQRSARKKGDGLRTVPIGPRRGVSNSHRPESKEALSLTSTDSSFVIIFIGTFRKFCRERADILQKR